MCDSPYGMSMACVNVYMWIQTDLTLPYAKEMGKTLEEMGIAPVERATVAANNLIMGDLEGDIVNMRQAGTM